MESLTTIALIIAAFALGLILTIRGARGVIKAWNHSPKNDAQKEGR
jgi:hypothetical protein